MELNQLIAYGIGDFFLIVCLMIFTKRHYGWADTIGVMGVFYLLLLTLEYLRFWMHQNGYSQRYTILIAFVIGTLAVFIISEYRDSRMWFTNLMAILYNMFGVVVAKIMFSMELPLGIVILVETLVHLVLLVLMVCVLLPPYRNLQQVYRKEWRMFTVVQGMFVACMYLLYDCIKRPDTTPALELIPLIYLLTLYVLLAMAMRMLDRLGRTEREAGEQKILEASMEALKREVEEIRRAEHWIATYNHDRRHFVRMIGGMMAEEDYDGVKEALVQAHQKPEAIRRVRYCDNIPLGGVVSYYMRLAKERHIIMTARLSLPEPLGEHDWELAIVLGNLIDYAIQLSGEVEQREDRKICLRARKNGGQTLLEVRNTYAGTIRFDWISNLPVLEQLGRQGLEMKNIQSMVEQWNGTMECGVDGDFYFVRILL